MLIATPACPPYRTAFPHTGTGAHYLVWDPTSKDEPNPDTTDVPATCALRSVLKWPLRLVQSRALPTEDAVAVSSSITLVKNLCATEQGARLVAKADGFESLAAFIQVAQRQFTTLAIAVARAVNAAEAAQAAVSDTDKEALSQIQKMAVVWGNWQRDCLAALFNAAHVEALRMLMARIVVPTLVLLLPHRQSQEQPDGTESTEMTVPLLYSPSRLRVMKIMAVLTRSEDVRTWLIGEELAEALASSVVVLLQVLKRNGARDAEILETMQAGAAALKNLVENHPPAARAVGLMLERMRALAGQAGSASGSTARPDTIPEEGEEDDETPAVE